MCFLCVMFNIHLWIVLMLYEARTVPTFSLVPTVLMLFHFIFVLFFLYFCVLFRFSFLFYYFVCFLLILCAVSNIVKCSLIKL